MTEVDEKLRLAFEVWEKMNENSKEEIKRLIQTGNKNYYEGYYDGLAQVHNTFNTKPENAYEECSRLIVLAYLILNHEDLNLLGDRKFVN